MGFKSNSFDAINEKSYSWTAIIRHIGFYATEKKMLNTYKLAYTGFEISTLKLTRIHKKLYICRKTRLGAL